MKTMSAIKSTKSGLGAFFISKNGRRLELEANPRFRVENTPYRLEPEARLYCRASGNLELLLFIVASYSC
jgi:hypothetical protein